MGALIDTINPIIAAGATTTAAPMSACASTDWMADHPPALVASLQAMAEPRLEGLSHRRLGRSQGCAILFRLSKKAEGEKQWRGRRRERRGDKPEDPNVRPRALLANPWGLANWFNANTPQDPDFASFYEHRALDYDLSMIEARAPADPVPDQEPAYRKSSRVDCAPAHQTLAKCSFCET